MKSIPELIHAAGGKIVIQCGPGEPPAVEQAESQRRDRQTPSGRRITTEQPPPREPCAYLGEQVGEVKVRCSQPKVPQHQCLCPDRPPRPSKRTPEKLLPALALPTSSCAHLQGAVNQPCGICPLWLHAADERSAPQEGRNPRE